MPSPGSTPGAAKAKGVSLERVLDGQPLEGLLFTKFTHAGTWGQCVRAHGVGSASVSASEHQSRSMPVAEGSVEQSPR